MSKKIIGPQVRINRLRARAVQKLIKKLGKKGQPTKVPTTLEAIVNRQTLIQTLEKYLEDGWDWGKFTPIIVARFPDGTLALLDGDHRRHMWRIVFGEDTLIDAYQVQVRDEQEYHRLFAALNKENRKQCSAEETFLHQYLGGQTEAINTATALFACNLAVCGSPDDPQRGYVGNNADPLVSVGGFRKAAQRGIPNVKLATQAIKNAWPKDKKIQTELLDGLAVLYDTFPVLASTRKGSKISGEFNRWFSQHLSITSQKTKAKEWKNRGGNVHHFASESTARGLLREFLSVSLPGGATSKNKALPVKRLDALFTK